MAPRSPLLVLALCALVGCGGSGRSDEEQIRATLSEFGAAAARGDFAALCDRLLAARLVSSLERIGLPCERALAKGFEDVERPRLTVGSVTVTGDRATAEVRSRAKGQPPSEDTVALVRAGDAWRIASLQDSSAP